MTLRLNDLKESNEFLNSLIDNINSAVFIVDKSMRIERFNRSLQALVGKEEDGLVGVLCGNALGCSFAVKDDSLCGQTPYCLECQLRQSVVRAFTKKVPTHRQKLVREFFIHDQPTLRYFEYTTKYILFEGQEMILVIVDDITESETQKLELVEKQKHLDEDLKAAAGIQRSLLPQRMPQIENLEIAWRFLPCEMIGGDILNVFMLDDEHIGCYMLDVSGHGVPSALVTVSVSQELRPSPPFYHVAPPREVCTSLDREYPFERFCNFFSIVYMIFNFRKGYCVYTNAGHPPPVLIHSDGEIEPLSKGGPVIGLGTIVSFEEERLELKDGDRIILYTDGVLEHRNIQGDFYGKARLYAKIRDLHNSPINELLSTIVDSVVEFGNYEKLQDDVSLLGIEFRKTASQVGEPRS